RFSRDWSSDVCSSDLKTSLPPSWAMKPKPLDSLNHFTWPVLVSDIDLSCLTDNFPSRDLLSSWDIRSALRKGQRKAKCRTLSRKIGRASCREIDTRTA